MADTDLLVVSRGGVEYKITRGELDAYLKDGYTVVDSMLFNGTNAYLGRTPTVAGNRMTFTWSGWVKRGKLGTNQCLFGTGTESSRFDQITLSDDNTLDFITYPAGVTSRKKTRQVLRDPSAWYHIVCVYDTTNVIADDRMRIYINGERVTDFSTSTNPPLNYSAPYLNTARFTTIGRLAPATTYTNWVDGYLSEYNFIDGQALEPSAFGETGKFGEWLPKKYTGTYGTNGFYLEALDSADLGKDTSGNGNDWINTNVVQVTDTPTDNYATLNPLDNALGASITNGNLQVTSSGASWKTVRNTLALTAGSWYAELTSTVGIGNGNSFFGIVPMGVTLPQPVGQGSATSWGYSSNGNIYNNGSVINATGSAWSAGTTVALTFDGSTLKFYNAGVLVATISSIPEDTYAVGVSFYDNNSGEFNFGQKPFTYTPPTGFKALSTQNLPDATVVPSESFGAVTYTGNGSTQSITGLDFGPDFTWIKVRNSASYEQMWFDSVRGATKYVRSNSTAAESTVADTLTSFDSNGFSLGANGDVNGSDFPIVAWNWKAGTEVTNNDGTLEAQVSANPEAGFSIATYVGNGVSGATFGHGLGVAPELVMVKDLDTAFNWVVYSKPVGNTKTLYLNLTAPETSVATWANTTPTASVVSVGVNGLYNNDTTKNHVAYCFTSVEGYSKIGSYNGNGSTDGPFIYLGFKPAFIMIKYTIAGASNWMLYDSKRNTSNVVNDYLVPNETSAEATKDWLDITANGFKIRNTDNTVSTINYTTGGDRTFIYMAFAEQPFKNANAR